MDNRPCESGAAPSAPANNRHHFPPDIAANVEAQRPAPINFRDIATRVLAVSEGLCRYLLPDGKRQGAEWVATNPTRTDHAAGSFSVNVIEGVWSDFATGESGSDLIALWAYVQGCSQKDAAVALAEWLGAVPVVETAPRPAKQAPKAMQTRPTAHPKLSKPSAQWGYLDSKGRVLCVVMRFETASGKEFRPITQTPDGWIWKAPAEPRPLYGLDRLAARPEAPVILCEGEKASDAAALLLPDCVHIASMNGAKSPKRSDWSPLKGRVVRIWPDADRPGNDFAQTAARLILDAGAQSVAVLDLSSLGDGLPEGWDAADAVADGWTADRLAQVARFVPVDRTPPRIDEPPPFDEIPPLGDEASPDEPKAPLPWAGKSPPKGWKLTRNMVFEIKEKSEAPDEYVPVCGPLWVVGRTNGTHGDWGLVLGFIDHDNREQRMAIPAERLHAEPAALVQDLSRMGFYADPNKHKKILSYIAAWDVKERILSAKRLGWLEDPTGALAFVMPDRVIGRDGNRELVYQPDRYSPTVKTVHSAGSLEQWRDHVARPAVAQIPMLFAMCAGLAPALLAFAEGADSYALHFWGTTSKGKTTLAQLAASPWGCAADPADAPSLAFIRRWNLTGNGLEGLAEAHSDLPLVLDELGAATVGDIRPLIYQLAGGQGKTAMNSAREMREPRTWRTIAISTGEMSLHARMSDPDQDGKRSRSIKGGLTHRALDIEVSDIAAAAPIEQRESLVSGLKAACARYYGTAGPEFVRRIAARFGTMAEARAHVRTRVESVLMTMVVSELPSETRRALRRFALIAVAGELAGELDILPVDSAKIHEATRSLALAWLGASAETDEQRIIASVRAFILAHESRFERVNEPQRFDGGGNPIKPDPVRDRVGFVDHAAGRWMFTDAGLVEAAPGHDKTTIARTLKAAGYLHTEDTNRNTCKVRLSDARRPRLYVIKDNLLEDDAKKAPSPQYAVGPVGPLGPAQQPQGFEVAPPAETVVGPAETRAVTGLAPVAPVAPAENTDSRKNPPGETGASDDEPEVF